MYQILGYINVALLVVITAPYWLKKLNQWLFHWKGKSYQSALKTLRKLHKPLGISLVLISVVHGYLALGAFRLHTGSLAWIMLLITASLGIAFYRLKKAQLFKWHKAFALIVTVFTAVHLLFPGLLSLLRVQ